MVYGRYGVACRRYTVGKRVGMGWPKKPNTHKEFVVPPGSLLVAFSVSLVEFCALRRAGPPYEQTYKRINERLPYVFPIGFENFIRILNILSFEVQRDVCRSYVCNFPYMDSHSTRTAPNTNFWPTPGVVTF